jgi:hypothetical protein
MKDKVIKKHCSLIKGCWELVLLLISSVASRAALFYNYELEITNEKNKLLTKKEIYMKKNLLLMMLCIPAVLFAQNGVTVSELAIDAGTVTFNVSWTNTGMPELWSDTVWVFVEYNNNGVMTRLSVTSATASAGTVTKISNNDKGVWVEGNARTEGSFSATVKLFTATADIGGACAYASNYPPVGEYTAADKITFTGTPDYKVVLEKNGKSTYTATIGKDESLSIPSGEVVLSFTDKTGTPGTFTCIPSTAYNLVASAASYCTGSTVTFALSNTTSGRTYWLYKGTNPVNTLTSIGGAATFTGAFAGAGVYTAQAIAEKGYCAATMTGTHDVSENPLPTNPTVTAASRCGDGTVTLRATSSGAVIDWYRAASGGTALLEGNNRYTTPRLSASTTYYTQARNSTTGCLSAVRTAVTATINTYGAAGQSPTTCGCDKGLAPCGELCSASCQDFTQCDGFSVVFFGRNAGKPNVTLAAAEAYCTSLGAGWFMPNWSQGICICENRASIKINEPDWFFWAHRSPGAPNYGYVIYAYPECRWELEEDFQMRDIVCIK